jgi:hypothetical protein
MRDILSEDEALHLLPPVSVACRDRTGESSSKMRERFDLDQSDADGIQQQGMKALG